jgi:carboxymethylenebutenolidase
MTTREIIPASAAIDPDPLSPLNQMQQYLVHEFVDDYNDGYLNRRDLVSKVGHIVGGASTALIVIKALGVDLEVAEAQEASSTPVPSAAKSPLSVAADDPAISGGDFTYESGGVTYTAYEAKPTGSATLEAGVGKGALILVCHENRGLTEHIRDVTRRFAKEGYLAVAVDLVSPEGGTAESDPSAIPGILTAGDMSRHVQAFADVITRYEEAGEERATRVGMTGFCFGGGITWRTATKEPRLKAAIPYYGPPPPLGDVPDISAAVLGVYSDDPGDFANNGRDDLEAALKAAKIRYEFKIYPGTQHAFNNDTGPRYNEEQANAAWKDSLAWFAKYLA